MSLLSSYLSRLSKRSLHQSFQRPTTSRIRVVLPASISQFNRSLSSSTKKQLEFQREGILDADNLVVFETKHEMIVNACRVFEPRPLFGTYSPSSKQFEWMTFGGFAAKVDRCRAVLKDLGIEQNDKIGIISNNRWEWAAIAAAAYSLNAIIVPMYEAQLPGDWVYIINDSSAKVVFTATRDIFDQVQSRVLPNTPTVQATLCLDSPVGDAQGFAAAMDRVTPDTEGALIQRPTPDDLADLLYTSGTTGKPKGVELTHLNITSNAKSAARSMVDDPHDFIRATDRSLAFLPWAHSYGQTCELWCYLSHGASMGISRGIPFILEDLQLVKPTVLFAVPTLYKKIYHGVHNLMENSNPIRKRLMKRALELGQRNVEADAGTGPPLEYWERLQYRALDSLVLSKIRARFGGKMRAGLVAGASCPHEVLDFMDSIGIPICEGYGLTETSPIITMNAPENRQVGTVGRPIGGVTLYVVDEDGQPVPQGHEGEICCSGPNIMRGYHNKPEATNDVISLAPDGKSRMFRTGDLGTVDESGFVKITGRLKEQYKLENGKYVVPTPIEEAISMSHFVEQVVLAGANRPHNVALIVPDWEAMRKALGVDKNVSKDELVTDKRVKALMDHEIESHCAGIKKYQIPRSWAFVEPFTAANNMMTPKLSIRRHKVISTYSDVISHLYGDDAVAADADSHVVAA